MKVSVQRLSEREPNTNDERAAFRQAAYRFMFSCIKSIDNDPTWEDEDLADHEIPECKDRANHEIPEGGIIKADPLILPFIKDTLGKPYLPGHPEVVFNLSHSKNGYAAVAAALSREAAAVGVDIERRIPYHAALARKICSDSESRALERAETMEQKGSLLGYFWSRKEAILKCQGTGIRSSLSQVDTINIDNKRYVISEKQTEDYTLVACMEKVSRL